MNVTFSLLWSHLLLAATTSRSFVHLGRRSREGRKEGRKERTNERTVAQLAPAVLFPGSSFPRAFLCLLRLRFVRVHPRSSSVVRPPCPVMVKSYNTERSKCSGITDRKAHTESTACGNSAHDDSKSVPSLFCLFFNQREFTFTVKTIFPTTLQFIVNWWRLGVPDCRQRHQYDTTSDVSPTRSTMVFCQ